MCREMLLGRARQASQRLMGLEGSSDDVCAGVMAAVEAQATMTGCYRPWWWCRPWWQSSSRGKGHAEAEVIGEVMPYKSGFTHMELRIPNRMYLPHGHAPILGKHVLRLEKMPAENQKNQLERK